MVRRERRRRVSVCGGRGREHAPTPKPSPKRQRNPATASRPRWGLYPRAARGWGAHLGARVGLCTGQGTSCPDLRVSYALRISYAAAGATTGLWLGLGAHQKCLGARNAHNTPRQKSQEPALPIGAGQGKVELAACDRHESDASAGRGRAMRVATLAMVRGLGSQGGTKELQNQQVPWTAPQPMAVARACWAEGRPERRPRVVRRACFQPGRVAELPTDAQTARRAPKTTRPKPEPSARCVGKFLALQGGGREGGDGSCVRGDPHLWVRFPHPVPPSTPGTRTGGARVVELLHRGCNAANETKVVDRGGRRGLENSLGGRSE